MRLLIIRHADPDYSIDSLTPVGFREAALLAERIAPLSVEEYYVSPLGRARDTASPTLKKAGREAVICDWLREFSVRIARPDKHGGTSDVPWDWLPGDWMGHEEFFHPTERKNNAVFRAAGVGEAYDRVAGALDALLADHGYVRDGHFYRVENANEDTLVFFCHFGVGALLLSHLIGASPMVLWHGTCMAPSSVTTVYTEERRPGIASFRAAAVGDTSHLYGHAEPSFSARFCEVHGNGERED